MGTSRRRKTWADRFRWYWKLTSRIETLQARWTGTTGLALARRSRVLVLETTGRRSGRRHRTPVMYWEDGDALFVGGGAAGMTKVDWVANVRANPRAVAWIRRRAVPVFVRELSGPDYDAARAHALDLWPGAARYERSGRPLPFFRLDSVDG